MGVIGLYAILAYPDDLGARNRLVEALTALCVKHYLNRGGDKTAIERNWRQYPNQQINGTLRRAFDRIEKRFQAAQIWQQAKMRAIGWGVPAYGDADENPLGSIDIKFTRRTGKLMLEVAGDTNLQATVTGVIEDFFDNPGNTFARVWSPSLPVLHLATALFTALGETYRATDADTLVQGVYTPDWLGACLHNAEGLRCVMTHDGTTRETDTIQVLLAGEFSSLVKKDNLP